MESTDAATVAPRPKKGPRVERRGRFTITEIEPDSPASSTAGAAMNYDGATAHDDVDAHHESGEDGDVEGDDEEARRRRSFARDPAAAAALLATTTSERISPYGSAVFEHTVDTVRVVVGAGEVDVPPPSAAIETAVGHVLEDLDERRARSPTMDETSSAQDNRRIKQKGRFTIIELSSDSPRSRRDSAEEFSTTTSISITSTQVSQANAQNPSATGLSSSYTDTSSGTSASAVFARMVSETNSASTRTSRSMVDSARRGRENDPRRANSGGGRRSSARMRSVSPQRDRNAGSQRSSREHLSASFGATPSTPFRGARSFDPLTVTTSPHLRPTRPPSPRGISSLSLSSSYSSVSGSTPTGGSYSTEKRFAPELGAPRRHLASRQKAITISAEQFIQQQHTIASLIRQQQELKQLISVLAEQQQHLVSMPKQLAEFRLDQAQSEAHEDSMREVQLQVGALARANDALQKLLSEAEQDAHERTMEIECLSNENNELRYRFSNMERRYHDEKKRSLTLEQELQRTRRALYVARHKEKSDVQKQKQLSSRASAREVEDPIGESAPPPKVLS